MKIEMPTPFHGNFVVSIRTGDREERERCQKLFIREIDEKMVRELYGTSRGGGSHPPGLLSRFRLPQGCGGKTHPEREKRGGLSRPGKEYEFMPFVPRKA
jgi:hypothetical protein